MKQIKPSAKGLNHSGQQLNDNHLQAGHKPLGQAQVKAIAVKKKKQAQQQPTEAPDADDMQSPMMNDDLD